MTCDEVQALEGACLDSELDTRTTLEIEQHLRSCPGCARLFAEEHKLAARLKAALNLGSRTPALWEHIERSVVAAAPCNLRSRLPNRVSHGSKGQTLFYALRGQLEAALRRAPAAWAGLALAWGVILVLDLTAREPNARLVTAQGVPSASEMRFAWKQKQLLMADLAFAPESVPAEKAEPAPPSPQSSRQRETLNT